MPRNYNRGNGRRGYVTYTPNVLEEAVNSVLVYGMSQKTTDSREQQTATVVLCKMTINNSIFIRFLFCKLILIRDKL